MAKSTEIDLTDLETFDLQSRDEWSRACAVSLIQTLGKDGCQIVVVRGFDEFLTHARRAYEGHAFKHEDYLRIFKLVTAASERPLTPEMILTRHRAGGRTH